MAPPPINHASVCGSEARVAIRSATSATASVSALPTSLAARFEISGFFTCAAASFRKVVARGEAAKNKTTCCKITELLAAGCLCVFEAL